MFSRTPLVSKISNMKTKYLVFALSLALATTLWSCGGEDEGPTENNVVLSLNLDEKFPKVGNKIKLSVLASSETVDVTSIQINATAVDSSGAEQELFVKASGVGELIYEESFDITIPKFLARGAIVNISVEVLDGLNNKYSEEITAEVSTSLRLLLSEARCNHFHSNQVAGYSLLNGASIIPIGGSVNSTWDLLDNSDEKKPLSKVFTSKNDPATTFVDLGDYDLDALNTGLAKVEFSNRSANTIVSVKEETKILAKIRGTDEYAVVHVRSINTEDDEADGGYYILDLYRFKDR